jgi:hypothetical protein
MTSGPQLFARFAYPPNALGYCGPGDARALLEHVDAGVGDDALRAAAAKFEGAWPYLQLIAGANGIEDPLDPRVVEAYWIGNALLDRVGTALFAGSLEERFRPRVGRQWERLVDPVPAGGRPHHNFHVFGVYPWLGLIRSGVIEGPLRVLDQCRIRWGQVTAVVDTHVVVTGQPLEWDGHALVLGPPRAEDVTVTADGLALARSLDVGDWCALHWDWVCWALTPKQLGELRRRTAQTLAVVNRAAFPAPAAVLS